MSAARTNLAEIISRVPEQKLNVERRLLRVLTLTPFYPSTEDRAQGCFISEPLSGTSPFGIENEVIAVQPFYRHRAHSVHSEIASNWKAYFSLPGNLGLPTAGLWISCEEFAKCIRLKPSI